MTDTEKKRSWADILKHPTANMILGFLLTGVIGTAVTNYYSMKREKESQYAEMVAANKEMISTMASLNAERLARAEMFLAALEEGDHESLKELKKMFKEANLRWKMESSPALMVARQVLPKDNYYRFRDYVDKEYNTRFLKPMGQCLKQASTAASNGGPVAEVLSACKAREYLDQAGKCNTALLDILYEMAKGTIDDLSPEELKQQKEAHKKMIAEACTAIASASSN